MKSLNTISALAKAYVRAQQLELMVFDVDGVLTEGSLFYDGVGESLKQFHSHDGLGLKWLQHIGVKVAVISARSSAPLQARLNDLGIEIYRLGCKDKAAGLIEISQDLNIELAHVGFMGDDWVDLPAMQLVGFAATVKNAPKELFATSHWVSTAPAGHGAVRNCAEWIIQAKQAWPKIHALHTPRAQTQQSYDDVKQ
jgi:3-deoxy-D-manno-octulosonate 8-phosphate phosphatase (KDO 8-P phosphatase)